MSKRRVQDNHRQGKKARWSPKKHLYLVLDDWEKGYSIYRIDPDTFLSDSSESTWADADARQLPEAAALRLVASFDVHFVKLGSNIVIVNSNGEIPTLLYDTKAAALAIGPQLPGDLCGLIVTRAAGDMLYALTTFGADMPRSFEALSFAPCTSEVEPWLPTHEWSWKSLPTPLSPFGKEVTIVSYAVHPDGQTIFMSTCGPHDSHKDKGTYSFNTKHCKWKWHGAWMLPFQGQGYFDRELDAWVGLHKEQGYICCCQVVSRSSMATVPPDVDKMEEKMFCKGVGGMHLGVTLTYMGDSKFCLVESMVREEVEMGASNGCIVHVTMFGLKFNRKGNLQITSHYTTDSFVVSKYMSSFSPIAFWM